MDIAVPLINTILNASEDLIIVLDDTGNVINMNSAWEKIETVNEFVPLIVKNSNFTDLLESTQNYEQLDSIQQILRGDTDEFQKEFINFYRTKAVLLFISYVQIDPLFKSSRCNYYLLSI